MRFTQGVKKKSKDKIYPCFFKIIEKQKGNDFIAFFATL